MNQGDFNREVDRAIASIQALLVVKGGEYAGSEDRLANFKRGATLTGTTPLQVLFIYLSKHYDAVATYVRDDAAGTVRERSEPIDGRLHDIINYCILALALLKEEAERHHLEGLQKEMRGPGDWIHVDKMESPKISPAAYGPLYSHDHP